MFPSASRRILIHSLLVIVTAFFALSCSCERGKKKAQGGGAELLPPLDLQEGLKSPNVQLIPLRGSRVARPVAIVLDDTGALCSEAKALLQLREERTRGQLDAHLICLQSEFGGSAEEAEGALREGLRLFRGAYAPYMSPGPLLLLASGRLTEAGLRMMVREPVIFSYSYLADLPVEELSSGRLVSLLNGGAEALILNRALRPSQASIATMAARSGLFLRAVEAGPAAVKQAIELLKTQDRRFFPPSTSANMQTAAGAKPGADERAPSLRTQPASSESLPLEIQKH